MKNIVVINIFIIFVIFAFIEATIRIFTNITPQGISPGIINLESNPKFNLPNIKNGKVFGKKIFTDENGFRINENFSKNDKKNKSIYFVGGSVTFGSGVKNSETFVGILQKEIKEKNFFNASVIGSNLKNNINIINTKINNHNLDRIFINFSLDDIIDTQLIDDENLNIDKKINQNNFLSKLKNNSILRTINGFIRTKSVTYVFLKGLVLNSNEKYYLHALSSFKNKKNILNFENNLDQIMVKNKELNEKITFLLIPYNYQVQKENCKKKDLAEEIIERNIRIRKFNLISFKKAFCNQKNSKNIFLKYDPSHLSPYGHQVVADIIKREIN